MDIGAALAADGQAAKAVEPREGAFDDPTTSPEPAAVRRPTRGEHRDDPAGPEAIAVRLGVVAPIALERIGPPTGTAASRSSVSV